MPEPRLIGDIELAQNLPFQHKMWWFERATWIVMLGLLVAIFLGLFGSVGVSNDTTTSNQRVSIEYQPYVHRIQPITWNVKLHNLSGNSAQLLISRDFMSNYQVQHITPQPDSVQASDQMLIYKFDLPTGANNMAIDFDVQSDRTALGNVTGLIGPDSRSLVKINQFVYP